MGTAGGSRLSRSESNGVAPSASPKTNTSRTLDPRTASIAFAAHAGIVTRKQAPESASCVRSSSAVYIGLIVVTTPPASEAAWKATAYSSAFAL